MSRSLLLRALPGDYRVARLDVQEPIPAWADGSGFVSISRSDDELSVTCLSARVPDGVRSDGPWTCFKLVGPFAFDDTGIVLAVIAPLTQAGLGLFLVSSFDGDHVLVKVTDAVAAIGALRAAGHRLE